MRFSPTVGRLWACTRDARGVRTQWYPVLAVETTDAGRAHAVQVSLQLLQALQVRRPDADSRNSWN